MNSRYPKFTKGHNGEKLCRGCGNLVPKGRQTWCSTDCYNTRCPQEVDRAVFKRDKGVCCICRRDTEAIRLSYLRMLHRAAGCRFAEWTRTSTHVEFRDSTKKIRLAKNKSGWPGTNQRWWQADHIIPFSEGGETVLKNMRTLCVPCHKKTTKDWHKNRKKDR